ncbi:FAD/NAD(P)-binding protein [Lichenibacterium dinghuense]|uniref:FAD/NAD(P)-binding protein n=1 Tax=Lichenibacterium dinghuense TaxID=2895977 RepID=UPI001F1C9FCA|nr:FAD/NAD(P)-binding protein [Lichenibacterium sp. 6Y81]
MPQGDAPRLVILGGGLTGAALAIHALRAHAADVAAGPLRIDVVEPAAALGRGAAYGTADPEHRINVPSHRMSLLPEEPDHLTRWLFAQGHLPDAGSTAAPGEHYVPRALFGAYAAETLAEAARAAGPRAALRHRRARASSVSPRGAGWRVTLDDGRSLDAEAVAVCTGHPAPVPPCPVSEAARAHPGYVPDPWRAQAFGRLPPEGTVLIVGTGLTMLDAVATLHRTGHRGSVLAVSRRGLLPRPQGAFPDGFDPFADAPLPRTAVELLRVLRGGIARLSPDHGWQEVADAFRARLTPMWRALPAAEQRRVARRLLPYWEVHRFRAAPQPSMLVERWRAEGRLAIARAAVTGIDAEGGRLAAELGGTGRRLFDAAVICTGPAAAVRADPLLRGLVEAGLARPDGVGAGVAVDPEGRLLDGRGAASDTLRAFGPITRGSFGEMTGEPDITRHLARSVPGLLAALEGARAAA